MRAWVIAVSLFMLGPFAHANVASDILASRTRDQQAQILGDIINAAGEPCTPGQVFFQGLDIYDAAYWNIACNEGRAFVIQIMNDAAATTTIVRCSAMKSLGATCFTGFGR